MTTERDFEHCFNAFCDQGLALNFGPVTTPVPYDDFIAAFGTTGYAALVRVRELDASYKQLNAVGACTRNFYSMEEDGGLEFASLVHAGQDETIRRRYGRNGLAIAEKMRAGKQALPW